MVPFLLSLLFNCQELAGLRQKLNLTLSGNVEVDLASQIDSRLEVALDELREKSEMEIAQFKQEMEESYRDKVKHVIIYLKLLAVHVYIISKLLCSLHAFFNLRFSTHSCAHFARHVSLLAISHSLCRFCSPLLL